MKKEQISKELDVAKDAQERLIAISEHLVSRSVDVATLRQQLDSVQQRYRVEEARMILEANETSLKNETARKAFVDKQMAALPVSEELQRTESRYKSESSQLAALESRVKVYRDILRYRGEVVKALYGGKD